MNALINSF